MSATIAGPSHRGIRSGAQRRLSQDAPAGSGTETGLASPRTAGWYEPSQGIAAGVSARYHLLAAGLVVQEEVLVPGVGRVDFVVAGRLIVEIDGFEFHSNRTHYRQDRNRWNTATAKGYHTLRITAELVLGNPELFVQLVRESLADTDR